MPRRFEYALIVAPTWDVLRERLHQADEGGGWEPVGFAVVDGQHQAVVKRTHALDENVVTPLAAASTDWLL